MITPSDSRANLDALMAEWDKTQKKGEVEKALEGPKQAADALARAMMKEFWQRGKRFS